MNVNPNIQEVGGTGIVFLITKFGRYAALVPPDEKRVTIIREACTNGAWATPTDIGGHQSYSERNRLTFIRPDAILGFEFAGGLQHDETHNS